MMLAEGTLAVVDAQAVAGMLYNTISQTRVLTLLQCYIADVFGKQLLNLV